MPGQWNSVYGWSTNTIWRAWLPGDGGFETPDIWEVINETLSP